jgi:adenine-specific DNA glycosylase
VAGGELARRAAERLCEAEGLAVEPGRPLGRIRHAITHHRITVHLFSARLLDTVPDTEGWRWVSARDAEGLALTSAGRRLLAPLIRRG